MSKFDRKSALVLAKDLFLFSLVMLEDCTIEQLTNLALTAKDEYENSGEPILTDDQYDVVERYIALASPEDDVTHSVGSQVRGKAVSLPYVMPGLIQVYEGEIEKWTQKHRQGAEYVITEKLDGNSVQLVYDDKGNFAAAYTRGDVVEGADITRHVQQIAFFPKKVPIGNLAVRAEVILPPHLFDDVNQIARRATPYKNPRNMVAGLMNATSSNPDVLKMLDIVGYEILNGCDQPLSKYEQVAILIRQGFTTPWTKVIQQKNLTDEFLSHLLQERKLTCDFELDGLVIDVNEHVDRVLLHPSRDSHTEPEYARKYKVADASNLVIAEVVNVHWNVSKTAYLKPRIEIKPVDLVGVTVTYATGFNAGFIYNNKIGPGAKVKITRSGDVIPHVVEVISPSTIHYPTWFSRTLSAIGEWEWTETMVDAFLLTDHPDIVIQKTISFFTSIDVEGLREGNIRKLFDDGYNNISYIIKLPESSCAQSLGENGYKIYQQIKQKLNPIELPKLMGASGLFGRGVGVRKLRALWNESKGDSTIFSDFQRIANTHGFDGKTAQRIVNGIEEYKKFETEISCFIKVAPYAGANSSGELSGQTWVFTGFRDVTLEKLVEELGGSIGSSVSSKTTGVVAKDINENSTKIKAAKAKGLPVISLDEFKARIQ